MKIDWKEIEKKYPEMFENFLENTPLSPWAGYNKTEGLFHTESMSIIPDSAIFGLFFDYIGNLQEEQITDLFETMGDTYENC